MKKVVWENKSNKQLCVTIPKNSGIKSGDIVNIEKEKIKKIVYSKDNGEFEIINTKNYNSNFITSGNRYISS